MVLNNANSATLHGLYFWGHGWAPYPSKGLTDVGGDNILDYRPTGRALPYRLALGLIFACDSNSGKHALFSHAPGGIWHGYTGTLVPISPEEYPIWNYIKAGDQRTKK